MLKTFPEVETVFGKAGRSDSATDPAPLNMIETWVQLKPRDQWPAGMTPAKLIAEMDRKVNLPGLRNTWGFPIRIRIDMLTTGIRTPIGVKISGPDLGGIAKTAQQVEDLAQKIPGTRSAVADRVEGGKYINIVPNRAEIARYGISIGAVQTIIQTALGGVSLGQSIEGRERYAIMAGYDRPFRERLDDPKEDPAVRALAATMLGAMCIRGDADRLTKLARRATSPVDEADDRIGMAAIEALAALHPPDLAERLAQLGDQRVRLPVRRAAERALSEPGNCR